jgi:hypothetical protein
MISPLPKPHFMCARWCYVYVVAAVLRYLHIGDGNGEQLSHVHVGDRALHGLGFKSNCC